MNSLFEKKNLSSRRVRTLGLVSAFVLVGVSMASYSHHKGTASNAKVSDKGSFVLASDKAPQAKVKESVAKLPLAFEPNQGQTYAPVQYIARAQGYTAFLAGDTTVLRIKGAIEGTLQMKMRNAQPASRVAASDAQVGKSNYLIGNDRSKWLTNVPHYGKVSYQEVYPGVDIAYSGNQTNIEYDFVVKPGADPNQIHVAYEGSSRFTLNAQGDLELKTAAGATVAHRPYAYQTINGERQQIRSEYVLTAKNEVSFKIGSYDTTQPLIIDPTVTVLTAFGGTGADAAAAVAVNNNGVYFTGGTSSVGTGAAGTAFPLTPPTCPGSGTTAAPCVTGAPTAATFPTLLGYLGGTNSGGGDAYVTKLSLDGTTLLYSTFLGGSLADAGTGIAVDATGAAYVTGNTVSTNFPVTNGSILSGAQSAFVTKLNPTGTALTYSEYFGANNTTGGNAITVDATGNAYIGGQTNSTNLVAVNPYIATATTCSGNTSNCSSAFAGGTLSGVADGLVVKLDPNGIVLFSSLIGASGVTTSVRGIALDSTNAIYLAGLANGNVGGINSATRFPTTKSGAVGTGTASNTMATTAGPLLGFATKVTLSSSNVPTVNWSDTFGNGTEVAAGIAVDSTGRSYIAGTTGGSGAGFTLGAAQLGGTTPTGTQVDAGANNTGFVLALASGGQTASYLNFLPQPGTSTVLSLSGIALDDIAQAYVVGTSFDSTAATSLNDIYVARLNPTAAPGTVAPAPGALNFAATIEGDNGAPITDSGNGIAVLPNGLGPAGIRTAYVVGMTNATTSLNTLTVAPGAVATNTPQNYLVWGTSANTLIAGGVTPAKLPAAAGTAGIPSGGGDAVFATLTFRDLSASSTNVSFATAFAASAGANQTQTITVTSAGGGALPCSLGIVPGSAIGTFFTNMNGGTVTAASGGSFTVATGTQTIPALGTPVTGTFQVGGATGCPFIEPTTVAVNYSSTTSFTSATVTYTPVGGTTVTNASSISMTAASGSTAGLPTSAALTVTVGSGTVNALFTSVAPTGWPSSSGCSNPVSVVSGAPNALTSGAGNVVSGTPEVVTLGINTACIAAATPGTYTGSIAISSTTTPALAPSISLPFTITINPGVTASPTSLTFNFSSSSAAALAQTSTLTGTTGGPFSYLATYSPAAQGGLPAANVTLIGQSGTLSSSGTTSLVVQVTPTGLSNGSFSGTVTVSPSGTSTFAPMTIGVTATVGGGILVTAPAASPLNITLPTGLAAGTTIPTTQLMNSQIVLTNASGSSITISNTTGVSSSFTGLATSPLTLAGTCSAVATNGTCTYTVTANTTGVAAGTYPGTITFTTGGSSALTATLPVNLTVTAVPSFILTTGTSGTAASTLLPSAGVSLSATANQSQVCTGVTGQPANPGISTTGSMITNVTYATSVSSGSNIFTINPTGPTPVTTTPQGITICANPQALGNTSGVFQGTVTVSSTSAPGATTSFPVSLLLNATPGNIDLSNIGVYRSAGTLGMFALDLNQSNYNYAAGTTLTEFFGLAGDQPVAGDWLGTGVVSIGVFRGGAWYFDLNNDGVFESNEGPFLFGLPGDTAIVGDWTGSGSTKVGVFRCPAVGTPGVCTWYLSTATQTALTLVPNANLYNPATTLVDNFGLPGDQPVANSNWGGAAGKVDRIGVFRCPAIGAPGVCSWLVNSNGDGSTATVLNPGGFGLPGDVAVVGDWNDNSQLKRIGVFRNGTWILDIFGTNVFSASDIQASFGLPGDKPVVGKWTQ